MAPGRSIVLLHGVQSSRSTWWRVGQDLRDLGWDVHTPDLLGHGSRTLGDGSDVALEDFAEDVRSQVPGPVDVMAGHSLGSLVALTLAGLDASYCRRVVIEDPPGLAGSLNPADVARDVETSVRTAGNDPAGTVGQLLADHPRWSRRDAENAVDSRRALDVDGVARFLRNSHWDLQALVATCPVPVRLLAATDSSALMDLDRAALLRLLPKDQSVVVNSGHSIHRDRPALWLHHVLGFAMCGPPSGRGRPGSPRDGSVPGWWPEVTTRPPEATAVLGSSHTAIAANRRLAHERQDCETMITLDGRSCAWRDGGAAWPRPTG